MPVTAVFRSLDDADPILGIARNTRRAVRAGYLSLAAGTEFVQDLTTAPFLAAVTLYVVVADAT